MLTHLQGLLIVENIDSAVALDYDLLKYKPGNYFWIYQDTVLLCGRYGYIVRHITALDHMSRHPAQPAAGREIHSTFTNPQV